MTKIEVAHQNNPKLQQKENKTDEKTAAAPPEKNPPKQKKTIPKATYSDNPPGSINKKLKQHYNVE